MRLIDLDKIDVFHQEDEDIVFDIIHATPVDAIPIDWILRYLFNHPINYFDSLKLYIAQMIQDWRKDNEID